MAAVGRLSRQTPTPSAPFGPDYTQLDAQTTGEWWSKTASKVPQIVEMNVPRDRVVAFALYTHDAGVLKLTAQLYPLLAGERREARLEIQRDGAWTEIARAPVEYPGWSAHFRVERWDSTSTAPYRYGMVRTPHSKAPSAVIRRTPTRSWSRTWDVTRREPRELVRKSFDGCSITIRICCSSRATRRITTQSTLPAGSSSDCNIVTSSKIARPSASLTITTSGMGTSGVRKENTRRTAAAPMAATSSPQPT